VTGRHSPSNHRGAVYPRLPRLLTVRELADLLQVPPKTIYTWRYKGTGPPALPIGRYLRFRTDDVLAWLETRAEEGASRVGAQRDVMTRHRPRSVGADGG
jgi:excisionase family DNA binding protein